MWIFDQAIVAYLEMSLNLIVELEFKVEYFNVRFNSKLQVQWLIQTVWV
jgi:hypothetical protein